jgi:hypothetical protein
MSRDEHPADLVAMTLQVRCPQCTMQPGTACLTTFSGLAFHHERLALGRSTYRENLTTVQPQDATQPKRFRVGGMEVEGWDVTDEHWPYFTQEPPTMTADVTWCPEHTQFEYFGRVPNNYYPHHPLPEDFLKRTIAHRAQQGIISASLITGKETP